jgi:hypothetical protein
VTGIETEPILNIKAEAAIQFFWERDSFGAGSLCSVRPAPRISKGEVLPQNLFGSDTLDSAKMRLEAEADDPQPAEMKIDPARMNPLETYRVPIFSISNPSRTARRPNLPAWMSWISGSASVKS